MEKVKFVDRNLNVQVLILQSRKTYAGLLTTCILLFLICLPGRAQEFSVRTNLLWDAAAEPNLGVEFPLSNHWSLGGNAGVKAWPRWLAWDWDQNNTQHWRNFAVVPEVRYYLDEVFQGFFTGADFVYTHYNVGDVQFPLGMYPETRTNRLQGSFWGGGLFVGYAWWPWQHWRLELEAGAAAGLAAYGRYDCPHCGTKLSDERKPAVVPKLALNVAWNPVSRDKHKARRAEVVISGTDTITVMTPPVAFVVHLNDVAAPETAADRLAEEYEWVVPIEKYRPLDYQTRPGRDSLMYVTFRADSHVLERDFGSNAVTLDKLQAAIETIRDAENSGEMLVSVTGLASIEGPEAHNDSLSVQRAQAVAVYLGQRTGVGRRHFEVIGKGEAWDWFRAQLEAAPQGREKLLKILDEESDPDARERLIKADKSLYQDVKDNFLEDQRNSGYIRVYYGNTPDAVTEQINGELLPLLKAKRYGDAARLLERHPAWKERAAQDPEAANACGIALYFTALDKGDEAGAQEAVDLVREAARRGSEAAAQNLKGIETYGPARKEYEAWQHIMKNNKK